MWNIIVCPELEISYTIFFRSLSLKRSFLVLNQDQFYQLNLQTPLNRGKKCKGNELISLKKTFN